MRQVVVVLHANNLGNPLRLGYLRCRGIAQPNVPDQPLSLQFSQYTHLFAHRSFLRPMHRTHRAVVDDIQRLHTQIPQVIVHARSHIFSRNGR
jgi:hypothetical protein